MSNDEKLIMRRIAIFVGIKVALAIGIHYASKAILRKTAEKEGLLY